jgi:hypothetical protein
MEDKGECGGRLSDEDDEKEKQFVVGQASHESIDKLPPSMPG